MNEDPPVPAHQQPSLFEKVGIVGIMQIGATILSFLIMTLFYTILPIAGLGLLPFLFVGSVCLVVGVCDDLGVYR
jgi:hypothetical protein